MVIRVSQPDLLPDLISFLARGDWTSRVVGPDAIESHPPCTLGPSARTDLRFSLAAWTAEHPSVSVSIDGTRSAA